MLSEPTSDSLGSWCWSVDDFSTAASHEHSNYSWWARTSPVPPKIKYKNIKVTSWNLSGPVGCPNDSWVNSARAFLHWPMMSSSKRRLETGEKKVRQKHEETHKPLLCRSSSGATLIPEGKNADKKCCLVSTDHVLLLIAPPGPKSSSFSKRLRQGKTKWRRCIRFWISE